VRPGGDRAQWMLGAGQRRSGAGRCPPPRPRAGRARPGRRGLTASACRCPRPPAGPAHHLLDPRRQLLPLGSGLGLHQLAVVAARVDADGSSNVNTVLVATVDSLAVAMSASKSNREDRLFRLKVSTVSDIPEAPSVSQLGPAPILAPKGERLDARPGHGAEQRDDGPRIFVHPPADAESSARIVCSIHRAGEGRLRGGVSAGQEWLDRSHASVSEVAIASKVSRLLVGRPGRFTSSRTRTGMTRSAAVRGIPCEQGFLA
jgi:hypothetical protein